MKDKISIFLSTMLILISIISLKYNFLEKSIVLNIFLMSAFVINFSLLIGGIKNNKKK
jgi:hypothetical protein